MAEYSISQVSRVSPELASRITQAVANQLEASEAGRETAARQEGRQIAASVERVLSSTSLRFKVNSETNDITIWIVDQATEKVIMTIPPEAIKDIPAGELIHYSV